MAIYHRLTLRFGVVLLISASIALQTRADWPQWGGLHRDGLSTETGLLASWPADGPPRLWLNTELGVGYSGPAIVGERLYILGSRDSKELLFCLQVADGAKLWEVETGDLAEVGKLYENGWGDGPRSTPSVDGQHVFALGAQGNLVCVDADSGSLVWKRAMQDLGGKIPNWGYSESPLVRDDVVLCTPGGDQGAVAALKKSNGEVVWQATEVTDGAHYSSIVAAPIHGKTQYIQIFEKRLVGLDAEQGKLLWSEPWPGRVAVIPTPIVRDNQVYVTSGYGAGSMLVEISADNSVEKSYDNKVMKNHHGGVVLVGDHLYGHSDQVGWVCQDWKTGDSTWRERDALGKGSVTYAEGMLYCMDEDEGNVALVKASPSEEGWQEVSRFRLEPLTKLDRKRGKIWTHPVICDGRLYLRDQDLLFAFDIRK